MGKRKVFRRTVRDLGRPRLDLADVVLSHLTAKKAAFIEQDKIGRWALALIRWGSNVAGATLVLSGPHLIESCWEVDNAHYVGESHRGRHRGLHGVGVASAGSAGVPQ